MVAITHSYNMNHSAISMILKNKDNIMECVKSANNDDNKVKEGWKSDGGDEESSQCADAGLASASSPTQLNADSGES